MTIASELNDALSLDGEVEVVGSGILPSCFQVTELAAQSIGAVGQSLACLMKNVGALQSLPDVVVDKRLASLWFARSIYPIDWKVSVEDGIAGDYRTKDGWIRFQTLLPHHGRALCTALGVNPKKSEVEASVVSWEKDKLEAAVVHAGGASAAMRTREEWNTHPQGKSVANEPLIAWSNERKTEKLGWSAKVDRPLAGLKVLDLTRILAGPVATRTLASFGAQVLRIDPFDWEEPYLVPEISLGKRCTRLDLRTPEGRQKFEALIRQADVFVHGYRPGALDHLGLGEQRRNEVAPDLVEVTLDAYGWNGPWAQRRGFDSLVQMSTGIAANGMDWARSDKPVSLPVQALDQATGYMMAAAVMRSLDARYNQGLARTARLSLARTAELLVAYEQAADEDRIDGAKDMDFPDAVETTPWGRARRLKPPMTVGDTMMTWDTPACELGSSPPEWVLW